jgi:hypothetical protein
MVDELDNDYTFLDEAERYIELLRPYLTYNGSTLAIKSYIISIEGKSILFTVLRARKDCY